MPKITLENWECARGEKSRRPRGPKPVARGQLLRATAWLGGALVWHDGALGWQVETQIVVADADKIERAGRALDRLDARGVEGETIAARREKWRLARRLGALQARDLDRLCAISRRRNPAALARLAPLLVTEALDAELPPIARAGAIARVAALAKRARIGHLGPRVAAPGARVGRLCRRRRAAIGDCETAAKTTQRRGVGRALAH